MSGFLLTKRPITLHHIPADTRRKEKRMSTRAIAPSLVGFRLVLSVSLATAGPVFAGAAPGRRGRSIAGPGRRSGGGPGAGERHVGSSSSVSDAGRGVPRGVSCLMVILGVRPTVGPPGRERIGETWGLWPAARRAAGGAPGPGRLP